MENQTKKPGPDVLKLAHEAPTAGHRGVNKTCDRILRHFFWPGLRSSVCEFVKSCDTCQTVGKPNQSIPRAPLKPIPAFQEPFSHVLIDCVGPLPKTRAGNQYLLTIMCMSTRFPEAIPLRDISAKKIIQALVKFFTLVGLPQTLQSDQGSNFMSHVFQQVMYELGIEQKKSSAYHPQSQGAIERFHQSMKFMLKTYCHENDRDWDEGLPLVLFAARETMADSLGFSPFELVFGHTVRGPLKCLKEKLLSPQESTSLLEYVSSFRDRLYLAREHAKAHLESSQEQMKVWYDRRSRKRSFQPGDQVLLLSPLPRQPLQASFQGPYVVERRIGEVDYVLLTPDRRKHRRLCHINLLKAYHTRAQPAKDQPAVAAVSVSDPPPDGEKALMRFLGMAGFYRKFCRNFSPVVAPLTDLLRKGAKFKWSDTCQAAFDKVKAMLSHSPVLAAPDFSKPFCIAVDSCDIGTGSVLTQQDDAGIDHPVCFFSKKFNTHQRNYSTIEKEALGLILALQHFEAYVDSSSVPVVVYTDHNPLTFVHKMRTKNQRLLRWSLALQAYNINIKHIKGTHNVVADALSRQPIG